MKSKTVHSVNKVRYEEMLPHEAVTVRKSCPVAYLPIGTIEWHGEHNCLGLDAIKIHALAMECARKIGGAVFPPLFYGEPREHYLMEANHDPGGKIAEKMGLPKTNFERGYMEEDCFQANIAYVKILHHILMEIHSLGFKVIILMAGHYPLLYHAKAACELFNLDYSPYHGRKANAWACSGYELVRNKIPESGDHGAAWETSLMMALRPDLVDLKKLPKDEKKKLVGVGGRDPRKYASVKYGLKGIEAIIHCVEAKVKEMSKNLAAD